MAMTEKKMSPNRSVVILFPLKNTYLNIKINFNKKPTMLKKKHRKKQQQHTLNNICLLFCDFKSHIIYESFKRFFLCFVFHTMLTMLCYSKTYFRRYSFLFLVNFIFINGSSFEIYIWIQL